MARRGVLVYLWSRRCVRRRYTSGKDGLRWVRPTGARLRRSRRGEDQPRATRVLRSYLAAAIIGNDPPFLALYTALNAGWST